jgi:hypothetical protein
MNVLEKNHAEIVNKIDGLTPDMIQEVIDFIDLLKTKNRGATFGNQDTLLVQQESLNKIWCSESEDLYEI